MFYLINSQFRTYDQLNIETYNTLNSNSGNITLFNPLLFRPDKLAVEVGNLLSNITGERFSSTTFDDTYMLNIKSQNCQFKFNFDNFQSNNPYKILGINSNANVFTNNFQANSTINNNFPIFESNIISLSVKKNIFEGTYDIFPTNYTIDNLCSQIQDTLNLNTQKSWIVNGNVNNRVRIDCVSPNIKFLFYWTSNVMYNVSNALGFSTDIQSNIFTSYIISQNPPLINSFITDTDYLYLNTEEKIRYNRNQNFIISPEASNSITFIGKLQNLLNNNTNGETWEVSVSNMTRKITIRLTSNNNNMFQFLFSDPLMIRIANCLGFDRTDTAPSKIITGLNPINQNINLEIDDKLIVNMLLIDDTFNYQLYKIQLSRPMYNPVDCINHINNVLSNSTNKDWNITSNNSSTINNNSYLNINLNDVDTSFIFLWGNVNSNNLSNSMGFANVDMSSYTNNIVGNTRINFNTDLNSNDRLYGNIKSNVYYTLTDYNIPTTNDINRFSKYLEGISGILLSRTNHYYTFTLLPISQRVQISIKNPGTTFRILFGNYQMKNIANMLGFENENMPVYETTVIGTKSADISIILTDIDILHIVEKQTNPSNIIKQYPITITQPYFNANNFIDNFQTILNNNTVSGNIWSVTNNANFLTIKSTNPQYAFQILWGDSTMNNISLALGFNRITSNAFVSTTSSQFSINRNINLNTNDIFRVNIRNTTILRTNRNGIQQFNITLQISSFNEFINILPQRLQSITNKLFRVTNNTVTRRITISTDSSNTFFKIPWSNVYMDNIARMLGFNKIDTPDYVNNVTSDNDYNDTISLLTSNIFFIQIAEDTNIRFDQIISPFNVMIHPNFFNPAHFFQSINNIIKLNLSIPFNIEYNRLTKKITISSTTKFLINFGNLYNLSKIMGFNFIISPSYEFSFTSNNEVDMTLNVLTNDIINLQFLKSITEYDINFYDFYALVHTQMLELYLYTETRLIWKCEYNTLTQKISIFLKSSKFKFITTDRLMKNLCIIYGFDPNNLNPYDFTLNGINKLSFNTYINNSLIILQNPFPFNPAFPIDTTRNRLVYSLLNNSNTTKLETIPIDPIIYTPTVLTKYLQDLLNLKIQGLDFTVSYDDNTKKITISNNVETNFKFRFLFGNSTFIDRYMGFNRSNINDFSHSITSEKEINLSSQFGQIIINPNSIIHFNKLKLCSINLPKLENITYSNNSITIIEKNNSILTQYNIILTNGYYTDISILIQTALNSNGLSGNYTVSVSLYNKMTISVNNGIEFKILWSKNKILSNMCGFNPIDPNIFSNTIISDFVVDFVYPKFIYINMYGLKYQTQLLNDNKHVFILNLNHLHHLDNNQFTTIINCPNNNLHQLIFTLYDEHYNIISPITNWELLLDFIQ